MAHNGFILPSAGHSAQGATIVLLVVGPFLASWLGKYFGTGRLSPTRVVALGQNGPNAKDSAENPAEFGAPYTLGINHTAHNCEEEPGGALWRGGQHKQSVGGVALNGVEAEGSRTLAPLILPHRVEPARLVSGLARSSGCPLPKRPHHHLAPHNLATCAEVFGYPYWGGLVWQIHAYLHSFVHTALVPALHRRPPRRKGFADLRVVEQGVDRYCVDEVGSEGRQGGNGGVVDIGDGEGGFSPCAISGLGTEPWASLR
ncbi:hypothetical protein B0H16DRAFT_1462639 [Mycena metata]|uniref:Uncharacterized protein n=1 Tax=Mycena metata TaxID=1033252 RepID=A0AAD7N590_9AGAR|nr:hypothetical protein B0H16DRAFT_1462639 [Mycena metata]